MPKFKAGDNLVSNIGHFSTIVDVNHLVYFVKWHHSTNFPQAYPHEEFEKLNKLAKKERKVI